MFDKNKNSPQNDDSQNSSTDHNEKQIACADCEESKKQSEEFKLGWQRAQADYVNLQKETAKQKGEWMQMMKGDILEAFIPVYDNFKKAFAHEATDPKQFENWKKGIEYIGKQFGDVLKQNNIEEIKTVGEMFDARFHEIVGEEESADVKQDQIIREVDGGYVSGGKVIKVAKVIVGK